MWERNIFTGEWTSGSGALREVVNPATGAPLGTVRTADAGQVRAGALCAAESQKAWAALAPAERAAVLRRAGDLFAERAQEVENWLVRETGSTRPKAALEAGAAAALCWESVALPSHPAGEVLTSNEARWTFARRRPSGVVAVIAPLNFPLILSMRSVAPALALGNAVLLKPDPRTAVSGGAIIASIFAEAGLPAGVLHVLPGGAEVGEALVNAAEVNVVSFTGSTAVGRSIGERAARQLKRVHLELGGNNALVVLPGADATKAASAGAFGSWLHQGRICMTTGRHIVHESLVDEYVAALATKAKHLPVGDPESGEAALGPIIDGRQFERIAALVDEARAQGATVHSGGEPDGPFYPPTVVTCDTTNPLWREEIFGPVAPVTSFSTLEEAARVVGDDDYGLSLGTLGDVGQAMRLADLVDVGKIHINEQTVSDEPNVPFGGVKNSGNGSRVGGASVKIDAFTELQWVTVRLEIADYPF